MVTTLRKAWSSTVALSCAGLFTALATMLIPLVMGVICQRHLIYHGSTVNAFQMSSANSTTLMQNKMVCSSRNVR